MKKVARATARDHEKPSEILTVFARFFQVIPIFDDTLQTKMRHLKPILLTRVGISPRPGQQRSTPVGPIAGWLTNTIYSRHLWIFGKGGVINKYSVRLKHGKKADRDGIVQQTVVAWAKLYIPSTLNIDIVLWHTQKIVCAVKCFMMV